MSVDSFTLVGVQHTYGRNSQTKAHPFTFTHNDPVSLIPSNRLSPFIITRRPMDHYIGNSIIEMIFE
jgi:hypothetical protein